MTCKEVMTADPQCCLPGETVARVAKLMKTQNIGAVPICQDRDNKQLLGIVTDRDLAMKVVAEGRDPSGTRVEDVMTRGPVTAHSEDDIQKAIQAMETRQVRRIPVVDKAGQLVGIIAQADIAIRYHKADKVAEVVEEISKPKAKAA